MIEHVWIQTFTGKKAHPFDLLPDQVCIEDIAHALANTCRFSGHCRTYYSVAEHSVRMSHLVWAGGDSAYLSMAALLHDAAEAYLGDVPAPLKRHVRIDGHAITGESRDFIYFDSIERRAHGSILVGLDLEDLLISWADLSSAVKQADSRMLATEKRDLMGAEPHPWVKLPEPYSERISGTWLPASAEDKFLQRFYWLKNVCGVGHAQETRL
jgi:hypothetical protein